MIDMGHEFLLVGLDKAFVPFNGLFDLSRYGRGSKKALDTVVLSKFGFEGFDLGCFGSQPLIQLSETMGFF